jgi:hypothetical protein
MERFLVAASDHPNGRFASRLAGLLAGASGRPVTMLMDSAAAKSAERTASDEMASAVQRGDHARETRRQDGLQTPQATIKMRSDSASISQSLSEEAPSGYDFLIIGLDPAETPDGGFSADIARAARTLTGP